MEHIMKPTARILHPFEERFALHNRYWQGCPTLERSPKGILYGGWYSGGVREPSPLNYNVLYRSNDGGFSWPEKPLLILDSDPASQKIVIDIQLWLDPAGTLWLFWVERSCILPKASPGHLACFAICCADPDAAEDSLVWSEPRFIGEGFLRCKPTVLADGRWLLPAYDWKSNCYAWSESSDQGKTFVRRQGPRKVDSVFDESMFFEYSDEGKNNLALLARTHQGYIARADSADGGITWSKASSSGITAAGSRLFVRRLASGKILLIYNAHAEKRTDLTAALSDDEGRTWKYSMKLDDADNISYPDAAQLSDGSIVLLYDHGRTTFREILCARFTEEDIMQGKIVESPCSCSFLHHIISKAPVPADPDLYEKRKEEGAQWVKDICDLWQ